MQSIGVSDSPFLCHLSYMNSNHASHDTLKIIIGQTIIPVAIYYRLAYNSLVSRRWLISSKKEMRDDEFGRKQDGAGDSRRVR